MSGIQVVIVAVGAFVFLAVFSLILIVVIRLRRVVKAQFEALDNVLSTLRADLERETPREPDSK